MKQEAANTKIRTEKVAAAEFSARKALEKTKDKTKKEEPKPASITKAQEISKAAMNSSIKNKEGRSKGRSPQKDEDSKRHNQTMKSGKSKPAVSRTGLIKLVIAREDGDSGHIVDFENSLKKIPDIRIIMVSGTTVEGTQIIVSSEKSIALSDTLRQLSMVDEITDKHADILIKLKPSIVYKK